MQANALPKYIPMCVYMYIYGGGERHICYIQNRMCEYICVYIYNRMCEYICIYIYNTLGAL
jgi:hypothetical protein